MKRMSLLGSLLVLLLSSAVLGQTFTANIQNQRVGGSDFLFDIYLLRTGGTDIYLGNSDFAFTFNSENFSSPSFAIVSIGTTRLENEYALSASIKSGNRAVLNVGAPSIGNQTQFNNKVEVISNTGNGTLIATVMITNISNFSGTAGLQWRTLGDNKTIVNNFQNVDPWSQTDISANGIYSSPSDALLPVELSSFTAHSVNEGIRIDWVTEGEVDNLGFILERRIKGQENWQKVANYETNSALRGQGTKTSRSEYSYTDMSVQNGTTYQYRLGDVDLNGMTEYFSTVVEATTGNVSGVLLQESDIPERFALMPAYPNPFNPTTTISYALPQASRVELCVFNMRGEMVRSLINEDQQAGVYNLIWDGTSDQGQRLSSGVYLVRMQAGAFSDTKKLALTK